MCTEKNPKPLTQQKYQLTHQLSYLTNQHIHLTCLQKKKAKGWSRSIKSYSANESVDTVSEMVTIKLQSNAHMTQ